jgi:hypothetical protein
MEARLEILGSDDVQDELGALQRWLADEDEFRGRVKAAHAPLRPGQMGGLVEALTVALDSSTLTVLAGSVAVWLKNRRSKLTVKITNADGSSQEITASGPVADTIAAKVDPHKHG